MSDHTPFFPKNLEDYAPWVSTHGLILPYGKCQCGCGATTKNAKKTDSGHGYRKDHPRRFAYGHHVAGGRISRPAPSLNSGTRAIQLTQGKFAIVDEADFEVLSQWSWCAKWDGWNWYAESYSAPNGKRTAARMHQFLVGSGTDHIDGDGLNNTRANLRPATSSQNACNRGVSAANKSGFKGVSWHKRVKKWQAQIKHSGKVTCIGYFDDAKEAALAYNAAAQELFGIFAWLNEVGE